MRIIGISDTHMQHDQLHVPPGDVLVHCGDFTNYGTFQDVERFFHWFRSQPHKYKVFIAGNHDKACGDPADRPYFINMVSHTPNLYYLQESGVEIEGVKFWGSPWVPKFFDWSFMYRRELGEFVWSGIPEDTNVLVVHGPPAGILDMTKRGEPVGCEGLLKRISVVKPDIVMFGHIHESYGHVTSEGVRYYNCASINTKFKDMLVFNNAQVIDL